MEHKLFGWSVNNKLERMWKEQLGANLGYCPGFCLEQLRKAMKPVRLAGVSIFKIVSCLISIRSITI